MTLSSTPTPPSWGGETVIGPGSTIGGNVFITSSVPAKTRVAAEPPVLRYKQRGTKERREIAEPLDYQI